MPDEIPPPRRQRWIALLLWLLPFWLLVSSLGGLWLHFRKQAAADSVEQARFSTAISAQGLADDVSKLLTFAGQRNAGTEEGAQGLNRAAAMIEGSLGPANAGYRVERVHGPTTSAGRWPLLLVTVRGKDIGAPPLCIVAGYDSRPGSPGAEANATGVASVMAAAHALANAAPQQSIVFAFLPHAYDPEAPLAETFDIFRKRLGRAAQVLVVESTGAAATLLASSRDAGSKALQQLDGLGEVVGAESICLEDDFDLSSVLFETGLPAVRIATRPVVKEDEPDAGAPDPARHAAATKALVTLIGRLSGS